jgi:hypothetical protein
VIQNWPHVHGTNGAPHGLAVAPGQPAVSYAGYPLKESLLVTGIDAEYLASSWAAMNASSACRSRSRPGGPNPQAAPDQPPASA